MRQHIALDLDFYLYSGGGGGGGGAAAIWFSVVARTWLYHTSTCRSLNQIPDLFYRVDWNAAMAVFAPATAVTESEEEPVAAPEAKAKARPVGEIFDFRLTRSWRILSCCWGKKWQ